MLISKSICETLYEGNLISEIFPNFQQLNVSPFVIFYGKIMLMLFLNIILIKSSKLDNYLYN